jgi:ferredoxin--NADP+ reductase
MLCGNPGMVTSARAWLVSRGYTTSRRDAPGQLAVENYW